MICHPTNMHPQPLSAFGTLLAENSSLDGWINIMLLLFSAAGLPALLGLLALWRGRPRASWAPLALILGGLSMRIIRAIEESRPWFSSGWSSYAVADWPLLLGLGVCAWGLTECRRRLRGSASPPRLILTVPA